MSDRERRPAAPGDPDFGPPVWNGEGFDPWLPARLRAAAEVAEAERRLFDGFWAALAAFLVAAARAVLGAPVPDATAVLGEQAAWERAMAAFVETDVRSVMESAYIAIFGPGVDFDARPAIAAHLAVVQNQLVGVSDHVFDQVAATVARSAAEGWSIPETAAAIDEVLSPANPYWRNRATTVARTTTIGALNAGRTDSFQAVNRALPDIVFEQQWVATLDARVRPSHRRADAQRVPVGGLFSVGGALLRFPGDPTGPPEEVINCRCTPILVESDEIVDLTDRAFRGVL